MKKIIMTLKTLNIVGLATFNMAACTAENGNKIEISYTDPSANTSESKDTILTQIIYPLLQAINIPNIKFPNGVKWTQKQFNNSLWSQKEILKFNVKGNVWTEFFKLYLTTEDHSYNKVEIPWSLENTGIGSKKETKIAVVSELKRTIDQFNDESRVDHVSTNAEFEKANNYLLVRLKDTSYVVALFYKKEFKFNVELKNLTASLVRQSYKENNVEKWEWFFARYEFRQYDIFPVSKDYIVTKNPNLYRSSLSEFNFPFADLEFNIIGDSIEKIN